MHEIEKLVMGTDMDALSGWTPVGWACERKPVPARAVMGSCIVNIAYRGSMADAPQDYPHFKTVHRRFFN